MRYNFGSNLIDGEGDVPVRQSATPKKAPASIASFKQKDYADYRAGERQSNVVDEQTKLAGMKTAAQQAAAQKAAEEASRRAAQDAELAADRAAAKKAQEEAKIALANAYSEYNSALEAQARARQAEADARAALARAQAEEEERNRIKQSRNTYEDPGYSPYSYVEPTPLTPSSFSSQPSNISPVTQTPPPPPVKTAPIDTILFDEEAVPIQIMSDLIFENIGGQELINIARNDTVNGQNVIYQPIKNLTSIQQEYNPNNIVALQATSDKYFQNFSIKLDNKVPLQATGPDGAHVYIEPTTGNLIVEAVNIDPDEQIEVEITTGGTIYEAEL
jgi:hypothetical protein